MKHNKDFLFLNHIVHSIEKIEYATQTMSYGAYSEDWIIQDAITRNIEIIGEAVSNISDATKEKFPEVEWRNIKAMRNLLIHEYFQIDIQEVWETIQHDLPVLKQQIQKIIAALQT